MAHLLPSPKMQFFDLNGDPLNGGKVNTYEAGTSTRKATYTTAAASVANANPVILDSRGEANIFWSTGVYKIVLTDSDDNEIYTVDNVTLSATGAAGASFRAGSGVASDSLGSDGDRYLRTDTGQIYLKGSGVYTVESTIALPASTIANTPSGNLAATDVQNALNELQTDIDTRALDSDLNTAEGDIDDLELALPSGDDFLQLQESASPPANPSAGYKRIYADTDGTIYQVNSAGEATELGGSGGGGGGSLRFVEGGNSPVKTFENEIDIYEYEPAQGQALYLAVRVPSVYVTGNPISLKILLTCAATSGDALINAVATLIRSENDEITSTANQRTTTNAAITMSAANDLEPQKVTLDISSSIGEINAVAISAGDLIKVKIQESSSTVTSVIKLIPDASEVTFI